MGNGHITLQSSIMSRACMPPLSSHDSARFKASFMAKTTSIQQESGLVPWCHSANLTISMLTNTGFK